MDIDIIGNSKNLRLIHQVIDRVADAELNVIVSGETGVGKEVVVNNLYRRSRRVGKSFIKINCAALPDALLESELFGYHKGAFTGAEQNRRGKFKQADGGVLFLDEIGDMSFHLQSKLLRVLQEGEFSPLGSEDTVKSNVWVVAATNRNLKAEIAKENFRADLYYRLSTIEIKVDPLRDRPEDIPLLIDHFWDRYAARFKRDPKPKINPETRHRLQRYGWPGNVRELQNVLKRLFITGESEEIIEEMLSRQVLPITERNHDTIMSGPTHMMAGLRVDNWFAADGNLLPIKTIRKQTANHVEKAVISYALRKTGWNRSKAAQILKISYKTLLIKIERLELQPPAELN